MQLADYELRNVCTSFVFQLIIDYKFECIKHFQWFLKRLVLEHLWVSNASHSIKGHHWFSKNHFRTTLCPKSVLNGSTIVHSRISYCYETERERDTSSQQKFNPQLKPNHQSCLHRLFSNETNSKLSHSLFLQVKLMKRRRTQIAAEILRTFLNKYFLIQRQQQHFWVVQWRLFNSSTVNKWELLVILKVTFKNQLSIIAQ